MSKDTDTNENNSPSRQNVLDIIESFINGIVVIRRTLVGFSLSALFLAPFAIALSLYLMFHPSFFSVLQGHGDFGMYLVMLLVSIVVISLAWIALGIRQYELWELGVRDIAITSRERSGWISDFRPNLI